MSAAKIDAPAIEMKLLPDRFEVAKPKGYVPAVGRIFSFEFEPQLLQLRAKLIPILGVRERHLDLRIASVRGPGNRNALAVRC